jgi:hypothetical protein
MPAKSGTTFLLRPRQVVDTGIRRHDEAGVAGASIIKALGTKLTLD